jgi:hypothetical protein
MNDSDSKLFPPPQQCCFNKVAKYKLSIVDIEARKVLAWLDLQKPAAGGKSFWKSRPEAHLFLFTSGIGATVLPSWKELVSSSIFVSAEGDKAAKWFDATKDVVMPGRPKEACLSDNLGEMVATKMTSKTIFGFFRGSFDLSLRDAEGKKVQQEAVLRKHLFRQLRRTKVLKQQYIVGYSEDTYYEEMRNATFCLIPRGNTPWTSRLFNAILSICIPVILSDTVTLPFERLIDWTQFSIKLPEAWGTSRKLACALSQVTSKEVLQMQQALLRVAPVFDFDYEHIYKLTLLELYLRRKPGKSGSTVRLSGVGDATRNAPKTFWSPGRGRFAREVERVGPSYAGGAEKY